MIELLFLENLFEHAIVDVLAHLDFRRRAFKTVLIVNFTLRRLENRILVDILRLNYHFLGFLRHYKASVLMSDISKLLLIQTHLVSEHVSRSLLCKAHIKLILSVHKTIFWTYHVRGYHHVSFTLSYVFGTYLEVLMGQVGRLKHVTCSHHIGVTVDRLSAHLG